MKCTRSGVSTAVAELPVKFVRYRMFDRDVTMSASTAMRAQALRTASCRSLSAALGACDMDCGQELFEGSDSGGCVGMFLFDRGFDDRGFDGRGRRRRGVNQELLRRLL